MGDGGEMCRNLMNEGSVGMRPNAPSGACLCETNTRAHVYIPLAHIHTRTLSQGWGVRGGAGERGAVNRGRARAGEEATQEGRVEKEAEGGRQHPKKGHRRGVSK